MKDYTPEQLEELKQRRRVLGEERIRQAEAQWSELIEQVRAEIDKGTDPANEQARLLVKRWMELVHEFTGGNPKIEKSLRTMYRQETTIHSMETRSMWEMMEYISRAMAASSKLE